MLTMNPTSSDLQSQTATLHWGQLELPDGALFGTDGIRGKAGDLLTAALAMRVGYWAGQVLREVSGDHAPVVLGRDSRNSSDMLATALSSGLTSAGLNVWDLEIGRAHV